MAEVEYPIVVVVLAITAALSIVVILETSDAARREWRASQQSRRFFRGVCPGCGYEFRKAHRGCSECGWGYNWWGP